MATSVSVTSQPLNNPLSALFNTPEMMNLMAGRGSTTSTNSLVDQATSQATKQGAANKMANLIVPSGGGGAQGETNSPGGMVAGAPYAQVGPTNVPDFTALLQDIFKTLPGASGNPSMPSFQDSLNQGMNSPIFQSIIQPALANLLPGEEMARSSLMDEFRGAGALGSGAMGVASSRLEQGLQGQRGNLISQVLANFLPNLVQGYGLQSKQAMSIPDLLAQVLGTNKPSIVQGGPNAGGVQSGGVQQMGTNLFSDPGSSWLSQ